MSDSLKSCEDNALSPYRDNNLTIVVFENEQLKIKLEKMEQERKLLLVPWYKFLEKLEAAKQIFEVFWFVHVAFYILALVLTSILFFCVNHLPRPIVFYHIICSYVFLVKYLRAYYSRQEK